jgi:hypothetical protein
MNTVDISGILRVLEHYSSPEAKKAWAERRIANNKARREADEKALEDGESTE